MKLRFKVDQADAFRRGIDRPKSIVSIEVNPADIAEEARSLIADHLVGIDVLEFFYDNGDVIKGFPIKELCYTSREPKHIVAAAVNVESLVAAIRANNQFIGQIKASFSHEVQFRLIEKPPKNEADFCFISDQRPAQVEELREAIRQNRRVVSDCLLSEVQSLSQDLHAHSYVVYLLQTPPDTASARFYFEPVFAADFMQRQVVAHSPVIVLNEKTGRVAEANNLFHALGIYLAGTFVNDLSILRWDILKRKWLIIPPESIGSMADDAQRKGSKGEAEAPAA
jgi:hypothetical protein